MFDSVCCMPASCASSRRAPELDHRADHHLVGTLPRFPGEEADGLAGLDGNVVDEAHGVVHGEPDGARHFGRIAGLLLTALGCASSSSCIPHACHVVCRMAVPGMIAAGERQCR